MKSTITIIIISIFLFSCGGNDSKSPLSGNISNLNNETPIYLDHLTPNAATTIDTAFTDSDGNFVFRRNIEQTGYYRLKLSTQVFLNLVLEKGDAPIINGNGNELIDSYTVEGSQEASRLKDFQLAYSTNSHILDSLQRVFQKDPSNSNLMLELQNSKNASINRMNSAFIQLINDKPGSLVSLAAVQQLDVSKNMELYTRVDESLTTKLPNNPWAQGFHTKLEGINSLSVGKPAPEISLNDPQGNSINLSSLKGKVVLIDFWASWCRPCRMENPNVVKAYNKYNSKGFDVFSVSLDGVPQQQNPKDDWINAIKADGLIWKNHASDLKGWKSSMVPLYGIKGIPFTLLIDENGTIVGQNLRGQELEQKLESIFK